MQTQEFKDTVNGIELSIRDISGSGTVPCVFVELKGNFYGLETIDIKEDDVILDIGANIGMFSIYVKKKFNCKVIAFEPVKENIENFKHNIIQNGLKLEDIEIHDCAITDVEGGELKISLMAHNSGGSSTFLIGENSQTCRTETLEKYITPKCKYLKIDCEGGEYAIIPTILDKLNQFKYIGIEYHKYLWNHDAIELHNTILSNFRGQLFYSDPNKPVS